MKYNILSYVFWFIIFLMLPSCSKEVTFKLPEVDPLLDINAIIDPDNEWVFIVSMAKPRQQEEKIEMNRECEVFLYENNVLIDKLNQDMTEPKNDVRAFLKFLPDSGFKFSEDKEYTIEVHYPGFEPVTAKAKKPEAAKINRVDVSFINGEMPEWFYKTPSHRSNPIRPIIERYTSLLKFEIYLNDPSSNDYYRIGIDGFSKSYLSYKPYQDVRIQYASFDNPDPLYMVVSHEPDYPNDGYLRYTIFELLYDDKANSGGEQKITVLLPGSTDLIGRQDVRYVVYLYTMTEDYYKYMADRWVFYKTEYDPFAEPIIFHSNVRNGCGIFAISSMETDTIKF